jgi:hypothetical protein
MVNDNSLTSYKTVRRFLKEELDGDISKDAIEYIQSLLEEYILELCQDVMIQQEKRNNFREFHGLPELKRFDISIFLNVMGGGIYSASVIGRLAKEDKHNNETLLSKANMEVA